MSSAEALWTKWQVEPFLDKITSYLESRTNIKISGLEIDHICYRCESIEEYLLVTAELATLGKLLVEGMIGGRPISTIELNEPIIYKHWKIPCIEVPCPKTGRSYKSGLEHLEIVIGSPTSSTPFESKEFLLEFVTQHSSPDIQFDCRAIDKHINADVSLSIDEDVSVKFHLTGLKEVCKHERDSGEVVPVPKGYFE